MRLNQHKLERLKKWKVIKMTLSEVKFETAKNQVIFATKNKKGCFVPSKYQLDYILKVAEDLGISLKVIEGSSYGFIIKK